jgi:DNA-binding NarL/FixJ family response regulator
LLRLTRPGIPQIRALDIERSDEPQRAVALLAAAVLPAQDGDAAGARAALGEALDLYGHLGAVWDARRAAARLRPFDVRLGGRGLQRRQQTGWLSLTEMKLQVVGMVAAGQPHPDTATQLFISRRTVDSHVSRMLAKLQLSSRWEVKDAAEQAVAAPRRAPAPAF